MATTEDATSSAGGGDAAAGEGGAPEEASQSTLRGLIRDAIAAGNGCLLAAAPAIVHRGTYAGRNIIGPNSTYSASNVDDRGYVPVEWWIMSKTVALNPICRDNEGVTVLELGGSVTTDASGDADADATSVPATKAATTTVRFNAAVEAAGDLLLGAYARRWPLTKVLDIGGAPVVPNFIPGDDKEVLTVLEAEAGEPAAAAGGIEVAGGDEGNSSPGADPASGAANAGKTGDGGGGGGGGGGSSAGETEAESQAEAEYPPIPCHVHCGDYGGSGSGKLEAYFFPPLDVPPYVRTCVRACLRACVLACLRACVRACVRA